MYSRSPATPGAHTPGSETEMERKSRELQAKQAQLMQERRKLEEERLLVAIGTNLSFHRGRPMAAVVIFR